jgi:hypothetical protein
MRKSVKLMTGTIGLAGGAAIGAAVPAPAFAATPHVQVHTAGASGCTADQVGAQCMILHGSLSYVRSVKESQSKLYPPFTLCHYTAKWRGDRNSPGHKGWTTWYAPTHKGCTAFEAWLTKKIEKRFKPGTGFYGYWKSRGTSHDWTTPVKLKIG